MRLIAIKNLRHEVFRYPDAKAAIETEDEYAQFLAVAERLTFKQNQTPEESALYDLVTMLVETYETEHYPLAKPLPWRIDRPAPAEVLQHIIESSGIDPTELVNIFGSSEAVTEVLAGTKTIDLDQAKTLADRFKLSPSIFLE
jgi:HTH-type transcriptional regulator / antitoxin HigA